MNYGVLEGANGLIRFGVLIPEAILVAVKPPGFAADEF